MEPMDIVERLKVDIEMLSMSPDENERLISETLKLALSEIQILRKKKSDSDYLSTYFNDWHNKKNKNSYSIKNTDVGEI